MERWCRRGRYYTLLDEEASYGRDGEAAQRRVIISYINY